MKKLLHIAATAVLLLSATTASAQETSDYYPHFFIGLQGGAQATLTHYDIGSLITPQAAVSLGGYFSPKLGARLHVQGWESKGGFQKVRFPSLAADADYTYKATTGNVDLLVNMTNILNPGRRSQSFNWIMLAGLGANYCWDFDAYKDIAKNILVGHGAPVQDDLKHWSTNCRIGTQLEYNFSRHFGMNLELDANYKNDCFNLKRNNNPDWQLAAFLGVACKFGMKKKVILPTILPPPPPPPVEEAPAVVEKPAPKPEPKPEPKPAPVVKEEPLNEVFFYTIRESDPEAMATLDKIAAWCAKYPNKGITIKGYADKGTGTPSINVGYAKARAEKVAKALEARGVARSRMEVSSYGDTVQPFAENDRNRCVIVVGE